MSDQSDLTDLKVMVARIDERIKAGNEEADHRHKNLTTAINGLASKSDHNALERRVTDIEGTQRWIVRTAVAINSAIAVAMAAVGKKLGVWS
jgi:hypothetical protein